MVEETSVLVLGGGWTGVRFARGSNRKVILTTRTDEKVAKMKELGYNAIKFDMEDESTWTELPKAGPVVLTFALKEE